ncbi:MAG: LamG domain-containing protein, partial [Candidatus Bathyarchaeia archaeon]
MDAVKNTFYTLMLMSILLMGFTFIDLTGTVNYRVTETLYGGELIYLHSKNMILTGNSRINVPGTLPPLIMNVNGETQPTLTFQVNVTGNMKIIPHLYDWSLDGVDDEVRATGPPFTNDNGLTVSFWFKPAINYDTSFPPGWYGGMSSYYFYRGFLFGWGGWSDRWAFGIETSTYPDNRVTINYGGRYSAGVWYYIVVTYKNGQVKLYENGVYMGSATLPQAIDPELPYPLSVGRAYRGGYLNGAIGEVHIYNRDLSSNGIFDAYNHVYNASGLVLYLDATFYSSSLGKYVDLSGNNNHGTPYGGVGRVISSNRYAARLLNAASDNKAHFLIPEKHVYRILDASNNVLAEGLAEDISDMALDVNGTVTLQLTPSWNNMDLYYAYYG